MSTSTFGSYPSCPLHPSCPLQPVRRRRRPYSLTAIVLGLLLWGIGIKHGSSLITRKFGIEPERISQPDTERGGYVHPRRR